MILYKSNSINGIVLIKLPPHRCSKYLFELQQGNSLFECKCDGPRHQLFSCPFLKLIYIFGESGTVWDRFLLCSILINVSHQLTKFVIWVIKHEFCGLFSLKSHHESNYSWIFFLLFIDIIKNSIKLWILIYKTWYIALTNLNVNFRRWLYG